MIKLNRKVRFSHPDYDAGYDNLFAIYTEYLFGSIGLKVNADIRVEVSWGTEDVNMEFSADGSIERLDGGLSSFILDGFKEGDTFIISGTALNNVTGTINSFSSDGSIMFTDASLVAETIVSSIDGTTPIVSMDFYPNLIENNSAFNLFNLTDRETVPKYYADIITTDSANPTPMIVGTNSKGWVTPADMATIYKSSSSTSILQIFVISHTFTITPLFLSNQLINVQKGLPPAAGSLKDRFCLKYVFTIDGKFTAFDPDPPHTTDGNVEFPKGQTAWYNEFLNGRPTQWTKESLLYYDNATGAGLNAIDYCKVVDVEAKVVCEVFKGEPIYILHVFYLPLDEGRYVNTLTDFKTNFIYERAVVPIGGGTVQGENTGDYHFLKNVVAPFGADPNRTTIDFQIDFSSALVDFFDTTDKDNLNYHIFITVQSSTGGGILEINQTALILDTNVYECDKDNPLLFQVIDEWQFFEYPHCNGTGYSNFNLLPMDTVLTKGQFHVKQGTELEPILLKKISVSIDAVRQNGVEEFPLESFTINTSGFLPNCDNVQEIYFEQDRDFIIPLTDCRNTIRLFRVPTLDIAGYSAYEFIYPFKVRWEEWRRLEGANRCFPTPTQNWMIYANQTGWSIKFSVRAELEEQYPTTDGLAVNPVTTNFEHITWGSIQDPCDIPYAVEFNTYDSTGVNNFEEVIAKDADTFVEATITGDFSGFTVEQLYGILTLDAYGVGGIAYSQDIGTKIAVDEDGVWYGTGSTLMATLTKVSNNTLKLSAFLDYEYLPKDTDQFILSAKVREYRQSSSSSGATCLNEISIDSFACGELEIIEVTSADVIVVRGMVVTGELRNVFVDDMILTFVTATTWTVSQGGTIDANNILSGTVAGNIISAPAHPYTDANVGDTIQGQVTGTLNSSETEINGIGDMQIGCTFFVS